MMAPIAAGDRRSYSRTFTVDVLCASITGVILDA